MAWLRARLLQAAQGLATPRGSAFWALQREQVLKLLEKGQLSLSTASLLVAAFSRAGELTPPVATAVARKLGKAFRAAARGGAAPLLLEEKQVPQEEALSEADEADFRVHFSDAATVFLAMKEANLLTDCSVETAAQALLQELLNCVQPQWADMTFSQLRRLLLLLGATAEPLGLSAATAQELLTVTKKQLRKMQKSRQLVEERRFGESIALLWPLAAISDALKLPLPDKISHQAAAGFSAWNSTEDAMELLRRDRDIVLHLLKDHLYRAISSRLPCSPFDLALVSLLLQLLPLLPSWLQCAVFSCRGPSREVLL